MLIKIGLDSRAVPNGEYIVIVREVKETTTFKRRTLEFQFEIAQGEQKGVQLRGFVNAAYETFSAHTKLHRWISVARNGAPEPEEKLDVTEVFRGKVFLADVSEKESKKTKNHFSNVTELLKLHYET